MDRVEITRAQFEDRFGIKPEEDVLGMAFYNSGCSVPAIEFIFIDESMPANQAKEVDELERMYRL